jgi:fatty acid desaturase
MVALSVVQWNRDSLHSPLLETLRIPMYALGLWLSLTAAIISHNHNHLSIWKWRPLNLVTSWVISVYYGYPSIAWVPTHNQVHHKLNNKPGDSSRSPKIFKSNHIFALLVYPTTTSLVQMADVNAFLADLWRRNKRMFFYAMTEYVVFFGVMVALFVINWKKALIYFVIPQQFALFTIQCINYIQHIETDAYSEWNHSRNFVSPILNALLFNNGYHTVHHMTPGAHWTKTPALHAEIADKVDSQLHVPSVWAYLGWTFIVRPFVPGAGAPTLKEKTTQMEAAA